MHARSLALFFYLKKKKNHSKRAFTHHSNTRCKMNNQFREGSPSSWCTKGGILNTPFLMQVPFKSRPSCTLHKVNLACSWQFNLILHQDVVLVWMFRALVGMITATEFAPMHGRSTVLYSRYVVLKYESSRDWPMFATVALSYFEKVEPLDHPAAFSTVSTGVPLATAVEQGSQGPFSSI